MTFFFFFFFGQINDKQKINKKLKINKLKGNGNKGKDKSKDNTCFFSTCLKNTPNQDPSDDGVMKNGNGR